MTQVKQKKCSKFSFKLVGNQKVHFKGTTLADFKPLGKTKKIQKLAIVPTLNKDKLFYTPTFIIPCVPLQNVLQLKEEYQRKIQQIDQDFEQIYVPRPNIKSCYCGVCRNHYEDYLTHISQENHKKKSQGSRWQKLLLDQQQVFKTLNSISQVFQSAKETSTQTSIFLKDSQTTQQPQSSNISFTVSDFLV